VNVEFIERAVRSSGYGLRSVGDIRQYLFDLGHFHDPVVGFVSHIRPWESILDVDETSKDFKAAVKSYQRMRPLVEDGFFGPVTQERAIQEAGFRCGLPDVMEKRANLSEWPEPCQRDVTTAHRIGSLRFSDGQGRTIQDAWEYGITRWNLVSGVVLSSIESMSKARVSATANAEQSGILAWSELPNNSCATHLSQSYNSRVTWAWQLLWTTIAHEVGHAIGLPHGGRGIMQPAHDPSVRELDSWDIDEVVKRYGLFQPQDPTDPTEPNPVEYGILEWFDANGKLLSKFDVLPRGTV
jgi:hypothetical protein